VLKNIRMFRFVTLQHMSRQDIEQTQFQMNTLSITTQSYVQLCLLFIRQMSVCWNNPVLGRQTDLFAQEKNHRSDRPDKLDISSWHIIKLLCVHDLTKSG
jgi:hypothetical protein